MPLRILLSRIRIEELLHLRHPAVRLGTEPQLDLHQRLKAGIQVWYAKVDELREFGKELFIESFVGAAGEFGFALCAGELGGVFVGLFDEFFDTGAGGVVVEEFVVAFFNTWGWEVSDPTLEVGRGESGVRVRAMEGSVKKSEDTFVYIGEVGAKSGDGFKDCLSAQNH